MPFLLSLRRSFWIVGEQRTRCIQSGEACQRPIRVAGGQSLPACRRGFRWDGGLSVPG